MKESMEVRRCGSRGGLGEDDESCAKDAVAKAKLTAASTKVLARSMLPPMIQNSEWQEYTAESSRSVWPGRTVLADGFLRLLPNLRPPLLSRLRHRGSSRRESKRKFNGKIRGGIE